MIRNENRAIGNKISFYLKPHPTRPPRFGWENFHRYFFSYTKWLVGIESCVSLPRRTPKSTLESPLMSNRMVSFCVFTPLFIRLVLNQYRHSWPSCIPERTGQGPSAVGNLGAGPDRQENWRYQDHQDAFVANLQTGSGHHPMHRLELPGPCC
jgi:hypothetical protein